MTAPFVATLIAPRHQNCLNADITKRAIALLPEAKPAWLSEGEAVDMTFTAPFQADDDAARKHLQTALRAALSLLPVDVIVQQNLPTRRKKLLLADMDSTMIGQECIDELAREVGLYDKITERAMRGELDFEPALRERVALLKGIPVTTISQLLDTRITLTPGGQTLIATMRKNGAYCALISGGFTLFTEVIAQRIGFHEQRANQLVVEECDFASVLAGRVEEPILGRAAKLAALQELTKTHGLTRTETLAVGDGANDLAMINEAGLGLAFHAKPKVAEEADAAIMHNDLTALLFAQGYRRAEFVEAI